MSTASPYPWPLVRELASALDQDVVSRPVAALSKEASQLAEGCLNLNAPASERILLGDQTVHYTHVDDTIAMAMDAQAANHTIESLAQQVTRRGFNVGELLRAGSVESLIGFRPSRPGVIAPSPDKLALLWNAITELIRLPRVRVSHVASVVGVLLWAIMPRRCLLAAFHLTFLCSCRPRSRVCDLSGPVSVANLAWLTTC